MVWEVNLVEIIDLAVACALFVCLATGFGGMLFYCIRELLDRKKRSKRRLVRPSYRVKRGEDHWAA